MPTVPARQIDGRGRLVMPKECEPGLAVTVQQLDSETWVVKAQRENRAVKMVAIPVIDRLPDDPRREKLELAAARHTSKRLKPVAFE